MKFVTGWQKIKQLNTITSFMNTSLITLAVINGEVFITILISGVSLPGGIVLSGASLAFFSCNSSYTKIL